MPFTDAYAVFYGDFVAPVFDFILGLWWIPVVLFSGWLAHDLWLYWRRELYRKGSHFTMLEILMPREVRKSPKAMELVLDQLHTLRNTPSDWNDKYIKGEVTQSFSLEMASFGAGDLHFYVRVPTPWRNLAEAYIYSNYKEVEIVEVADYVDRLPSQTKDLYKTGLNLFGIELKLRKAAAYPIRTYPLFEALEEEKSLDPMSTIIEALSRVRRGEMLWLQIVIQPAGTEWREEGDLVVKELKERGSTRLGPEGRLVPAMRTPGETAVLEAIERNISKPGFETVIRWVYFAPRATFNIQLPMRGVRSAFNQYAAANMNAFSPNALTWPLIKWFKFPFFFKNLRIEGRKQVMLRNYRTRALPEDMGVGKFFNSQIFYFNNKVVSFVLSSESLATLFHPPSFLVLTAPFMKRVESKRLGPPAGLPIYGGDEELPGLEIPGRPTQPQQH